MRFLYWVGPLLTQTWEIFCYNYIENIFYNFCMEFFLYAHIHRFSLFMVSKRPCITIPIFLNIYLFFEKRECQYVNMLAGAHRVRKRASEGISLELWVDVSHCVGAWNQTPSSAISATEPALQPSCTCLSLTEYTTFHTLSSGLGLLSSL